MLRRAVLKKKREKGFSLQQSVNQPCLPAYNALTDPFLTGFFDSPHIKRHLRNTGVLTRKRKFSLTPIKHQLDHRPTTTPEPPSRSAQLTPPPNPSQPIHKRVYRSQQKSH